MRQRKTEREIVNYLKTDTGRGEEEEEGSPRPPLPRNFPRPELLTSLLHLYGENERGVLQRTVVKIGVELMHGTGFRITRTLHESIFKKRKQDTSFGLISSTICFRSIFV